MASGSLAARSLLLAAILALAPRGAGAEVSLVVDSRRHGPAARKALTAGQSALVKVRELDAIKLGDPILKGRFVGGLADSELIVVVGLEAGEWISREVEDVPVYFAGGIPRVAGADLTANKWTGSMPYSAEQILDFAGAMGWKSVGIAYTPGYEPVLATIRSAARTRGIRLIEKAVEGAAKIPSTLAGLMQAADAVWLLGDPLLTRGAGFEFIVEHSLSVERPVIAPEPALVAEGAFVGVEPDWDRILSSAAALAADFAAGGTALPAARIETSPEPGRMIVNQVLARRWRISLPGALR